MREIWSCSNVEEDDARHDGEGRSQTQKYFKAIRKSETPSKHWGRAKLHQDNIVEEQQINFHNNLFGGRIGRRRSWDRPRESYFQKIMTLMNTNSYSEMKRRPVIIDSQLDGSPSSKSAALRRGWLVYTLSHLFANFWVAKLWYKQESLECIPAS